MLNVLGVTEAEKIEEAIRMLNTYVAEERIKPFTTALDALKDDPENESLLKALHDTFKNLGIEQGAVLTYAPSIYHLIAGNPFNE